MSIVQIKWGDTSGEDITLTGGTVNVYHNYSMVDNYTVSVSGRTTEISEMVLSGNSITGITGLEQSGLTITSIDLSNNKLNNLPYINNNLKHLYLNNNEFISGTTLTGTTTDYDGNIYRYITIGSQQWMVENLKTTHYADGTPIPLATGNTSISLTSGCVWVSTSPTGFTTFNSSGLNISTAYTLSSTTSRAKLVTNSGTTQPLSLRIYFTLYYYSNYYLPRLIVTDENDIEFLNTELYTGSNDFYVNVSGSTGKFTLWLYNTDQNKLNPYPTYFNSFNNLIVEGYYGWVGNTDGAYCWYNDNISNKDVYGALYNWYAVDNIHGLAPSGWRIPSNLDWSMLTSFIGEDSNAGRLLKETGSTHWNVSGGIDSYGFTALPGGYRYANGFSNMNSSGYWWSSDRYNKSRAKFNYIYSSQNNIYRDSTYEFYHGFSIRCVRDVITPITNQYSGTSLETLKLDNGSFKTYSSGSLPDTMYNFSANNTSLDSTSVSNILSDMYNNSSSKSGMVISLVNVVGALTGMTQKYNLIDNSGSTVNAPGRFQILVDRTNAQSLYRSPFTISFTKPITPTNINITANWGDGLVESVQFNSATTSLSLSHTYYTTGVTYVANFDAYWDYVTELSTRYSHYNNCPIDVREFVGLKRLDTANDTSNNYDNLFGGVLNLYRNNSLEELIIRSNKFTSMVYPTDITKLRRMEVQNCTGVIAPPLSGMPNFEYIDAQNTNMTGNLSDVLSKKITYFNIYSNPTLTMGAIPNFTDNTGLTYLRLYNSNRNSNGTTNFTTLTSLQTLDLSNNTFSLTPIVPILSGLSNLAYLTINSTGYQWVGDTNWDTLPGLISINMRYNNSLSGSTPSLSGSTLLQTYEIYSNKLYGHLPNFAPMINLTNLDIQYNNNGATPTGGISGPFPNLSTNTKLQYVKLSNNYLNREYEINSSVNVVTIDNSGRTYLGGSFTRFDIIQNRISRLNSDGTRDTSFNTEAGFDNTVNAIEVDLSGRSYIGGYFTQFNGSTQNRFIRLNNDGTKDTSFNIGSGFNQVVTCLALDNSGRTYVGGQFNQYSGVTQYYLIRLNSDGTKDTSFNIGSGFNQPINVLLYDSNNDKLYVGGQFTQYSGTTQTRLIRLNSDASIDTSFNIGSQGFSSTVYSLNLDSNGKLYVGGVFTNFSGSTQNYMVRLNSNGTKDTSFNIGDGFNSVVYGIVNDSSGNTYVGGFFNIFSGSTQRYLVRLDSGGTKDTSYDIGLGFTSGIYSMRIDSNDKLYVGGAFYQYSGNTQKYYVKLNNNATKDTSYQYNPSTYMLDLSKNTGLTSLSLDSCNMDFYHPSLSALTLLTNIEMRSNNLIEFPDTSRLLALRYIYMSSNRIRESIPITLSANTGLSGMDFSSNEIIGTIPEWIGGFTTLQTINFSSNRMSGALPLSFSGMTQLNIITLSSNLFTSGLTIFSGRTSITQLLLNNNNFSGETMFSLQQFNNLSQINVSYCNLSGNIILPSSPNQNYYQRSFNNNWFTGDIPSLPTTYSYYGTSIQHYFNDNYFTGYTSMVGSQHYCYSIYFQNNYLSVTEINKVLADAVKAIHNNGSLNISGPYMAVPTGQGLIDVDTLVSTKYWNVTLGVLYLGGFGFDNTINSIDLESSGKVYAAGNYIKFSGSTQRNLIRMDSGGTKDISFSTGNTFNSAINSIAVDASGKTYVGGQFTQYGTSNYNFIMRLDSGGTPDSTFPTSNKLNSHVYSIALDLSGRSYLAGVFSTYDSGACNYIIRLDSGATRDSSFVVGTGFNASTNVVIYDSTIDKIYVGGGFTSYRSSTQIRLARINSNGDADVTFNVGSQGFNTQVYALAVDSSTGKIYVGGEFTQFGGSTQNRFIRLDTDGTKDTSFDIGTGFTGIVRAVAVDSVGKVYVGGEFTEFSGITQNRLIRLNTDGTKDTAFDINSGFSGTVKSIKIDSNGKILVGGDFYLYNKIPYNRMVRLNTNGTVDTSFDIGDSNTAIVDSISNRLTFTYTGATNTASYLTVSGSSYIMANSGGSFVWDLGGLGEYKFTSFTTITRNLNGSNHTIQLISGSSGAFVVKVKKV